MRQEDKKPGQYQSNDSKLNRDKQNQQQQGSDANRQNRPGQQFDDKNKKHFSDNQRDQKR